MNLADRAIDAVPFVVVDVETTGLDPTEQRVVEICAVLVRVGRRPKVLVDTLIRPERAIAATYIHGITDEDVRAAPRFADLMPTIESVLAGRVVAGHNVSFDLGFLKMEFARLGHTLDVPHVCTMRLPGLFDRPANWPLWWACQRAGVPFDGQAHSARGDALATAGLLRVQLSRVAASGVETFGQLSAWAHRVGAGDGFARSLDLPLVPAPPRIRDAAQVHLEPRAAGERGARAVSPRRRYMDAVVRAIATLDVDEAGRRDVARARRILNVDAETARSVHARILSGARRRYAEDGYIDEIEAGHLDALERCLQRLDPSDEETDP